MIVGPAPLWLLAAAFAAALPVALHLTARRRARVIDFPAARFIALAAEGPARRALLRDRLLMLLRSAAMALLVLAASGMQWAGDTPLNLAEPGPLRAALATGTDAPRRVVIVIDASASMTRTQGGVTLFDRAREHAQRALGALRPGVDHAGVIIARRTPEPLLPAMTTNTPALTDLLASTTVTMEHADLAQAVAAASALVQQGSSATIDASTDASPSAAQLLVLTDAQSAAPSDIEAATGRHPVFVVPHVIDLSDGAVRTNLAMLRVRARAPAGDAPPRIAAEVANFSDHPRLARVDFDTGTAAATASRMLDPGQTAWLEASIDLSRSRDRSIRAAVDDPGFTADNTAHVPLPGLDDPPLILSSGAPSAALAAIRAAVDAWAAAPSRVISPGDAAALDTDAPVILVSPIALDDASASTLRARASRGAPLLVFAWSDEDAPALRSLGLRDAPSQTPASLIDNTTHTAEHPVRLAPNSVASDALRAAALGLERAGVRAAHDTSQGIRAASPVPGESLIDAGGRSIVSLRALGAASIAVFTIDPTLGTAPASESAWFAVLLARLIDAAASDIHPRTVTVGDIPAPGMPPASEPGIVSIPASSERGHTLVRVMLDPRESDLRGPSSLAPPRAPPSPTAHHANTGLAPSTDRASDASTHETTRSANAIDAARTPLAPLLLTAALVVLTLDVLVSSRTRRTHPHHRHASSDPARTATRHDPREEAA